MLWQIYLKLKLPQNLSKRTTTKRDKTRFKDSSASLAKVDHSIIGWNVQFGLFWVLRQSRLTEIIGCGRLVIGTILLPLCIAAWKLDDGKYWKYWRYHCQRRLDDRNYWKYWGQTLTWYYWHLVDFWNKLNCKAKSCFSLFSTRHWSGHHSLFCENNHLGVNDRV